MNKKKINPKGPAKGSDRVIRGGSWLTPAKFMLFAQCNHIDSGYHDYSISFRLIRMNRTKLEKILSKK